MTYDSENGGLFEVHIPGKSSLYFPCYSNGLHVHECNTKGSFIENIGILSEKSLRTLIRSGAILNCPIIIEDVDTYFKNYKKNTLALKENTTRTRPNVQDTAVIKVPPCILDKHTIVTL